MNLLKKIGQGILFVIQLVTIGVILGMIIPSILYLVGVTLSPLAWFIFLSIGVTVYGGYILLTD